MTINQKSLMLERGLAEKPGGDEARFSDDSTAACAAIV